MAGNKSEKSPSGDPMIDDYLRAWLRNQRNLMAGNDWSRFLSNAQNVTFERLSESQRLAMHALNKRPAGYIMHDDVVRLYGEEAGFSHGT